MSDARDRPTADPADDPSPPVLFEDAVCPACGCLCDDLALTVRAGAVVDDRNACDLGRAWIEAAGLGQGGPAAAVEGREATPDAALDLTAEILRRARRPAFVGLTRTVTETAQLTVGLADRLGGLVLLSDVAGRRARAAAYQEAGKVTATLGEVKARADLVVFWGGHPDAFAPRHAGRYSVEPAGRFLPGGRADRTVVVVDEPGAEAVGDADVRIALPADRELDLIAALRAALRRPDEADGLATGSGLDPGAFGRLLGVLTAARIGALFFRPTGGHTRAAWVGATGLVRDLNDGRRFLLMEFGAAGNATGAAAALTWQAGFAPAVDFRLGVPRESSETVDDLVARGSADAYVVIADPTPDALGRLAGAAPLIVIAPDATTRNAPTPTVALNSALLGLETAGSLARSDGVALPLRPVRAGRFPTDRAWLRRLGRRLDAAT